jgi:hypothetical protein
VPDGIYRLNYAKSTIRGPFPLKGHTMNTAGGATTVIGFGPDDRPLTTVLPYIVDGKPHPITGSPVVDSETRTYLDMYTSSIKRTKEGQLVQTGYEIFNPQTNTFTLSLSFVDTPYSYFWFLRNNKPRLHSASARGRPQGGAPTGWIGRVNEVTPP